MISKLWPPETPPRPAEASTLTAALNQPQPDTTVCTVTGTINADTTPVLRNALAQAHRDDNAHLVIDLSTVTSMDANGLYALFEALNEHNLGGGHPAVVIDPHSQAIHELHIFALQAAFDLHHDLARALHACANAGTATERPTASDRRLSNASHLLVIVQSHSPHVARLTEYVLITRTIHYTGQLSEHMMTPVEQDEATTQKMLDDAYYRAFRRYTGD
jgi:anti-anti-sigma factor